MPSDDPRIRTVVFDLGNVLVRWDRRLLFEKLIDDPVELDRFLDDVLTLEVNADLDRGVPLAEVTESLAGRFPAQRSLIEAFRDRWEETLGEILSGTVTILEELSADPDLQLLALSNWGKDTFARSESRLPFLAHFHGLVISGREGVVKPDPAIFRLLCERHRVDPRRAVFVDDSETNTRVAADLGFHTVLFESAEQLRDRLRGLGLDLAPGST